LENLDLLEDLLLASINSTSDGAEMISRAIFNSNVD
jgi:hypothetical protein